MKNNAYVYFMTNTHNTVLYIGVTNNLQHRVWEHKEQLDRNSFTAKYGCNKLVYFEHTNSISAAIMREKQLKKWNREWKDALVEEQNPGWEDLYIND